MKTALLERTVWLCSQYYATPLAQKDSRQFFIQSERSKAKTNRDSLTHVFPRWPSRRLHIITLSFDWLTAFSTCCVIGWSEYFGFTTLLKTALRIHNKSNSLLARTTVLFVDLVSHEHICSDLTDYLFLSLLSSMKLRSFWCYCKSRFSSSACILVNATSLPLGMILQV